MEFIFTKEVEQRMGKYESGHHVGVGKVALAMYRDLGLLEKPDERNISSKASTRTSKDIIVTVHPD